MGDLELGACVPRADPPAPRGRATPSRSTARRSVAFVHFGGTTRCSPKKARRQLAEALDELVSRGTAAAEEHGVTVLERDIDADGGKIDPRRRRARRRRARTRSACCAPLRTIADAALRAPAAHRRHRGRVFAGEVGAPFRRTYTILGKTAALAARLMGKAEPGQVLATSEVLERSRSTFETTELQPFRLKGSDEPVHGVRRRRTARRHREPSDQLPFVGRERELAILSASLGPVRMGFGNLVELIGEPGMGKSRLVAELQAQAPDL